MMGALDAATRELMVSTSPTKVSADFIAFLRRLDWRYGPKPGSTRLPVVLVLDNGPVHTSKASRAALDARPWITVEWLPRYAPELNDIERSWRDLKRHHLAHHTFKETDDLNSAIHALVRSDRQGVARTVSKPRSVIGGQKNGQQLWDAAQGDHGGSGQDQPKSDQGAPCFDDRRRRERHMHS